MLEILSVFIVIIHKNSDYKGAQGNFIMMEMLIMWLLFDIHMDISKHIKFCTMSMCNLSIVP